MKKEHCPHCGQSIMKHKQSLSRALVMLLFKAAGCGVESFHLQKDLTLTHNEYTNFQKLKFWGLVSRSGDDAGRWHVTKDGYFFMAGEIRMPKSVWTFNNKAVMVDPAQIGIHDLKLLPVNYKQRDQYAEEALPVDGLGQMEFIK